MVENKRIAKKDSEDECHRKTKDQGVLICRAQQLPG